MRLRLTIRWASKVTGIPARTLHRWAHDGDLTVWDGDDGAALIDPDEAMRVRKTKAAAKIRNLRDTPS